MVYYESHRGGLTPLGEGVAIDSIRKKHHILDSCPAFEDTDGTPPGIQPTLGGAIALKRGVADNKARIQIDLQRQWRAGIDWMDNVWITITFGLR